MKRSPLLARTSLKRSSALRTRHRPPSTDLARKVWKEPRAGWCECGCGEYALHLERHHVFELQMCKRERLPLWDLANSMLLSPHCHARHTSALRRLPIHRVPKAAIRWGVDQLGSDRAWAYLVKKYAVTREREA